MVNGGGGRLLPITAAFLMLAGLSLSLALVFLGVPGNEKIDEALLLARVAVDESDVPTARRELLRASRHAVSAGQWTNILSLTAELIPAEPRPQDYRLFATLAGRASASIPGNQDLAAYMVWGRLRLGRLEKAMRHAESLNAPEWSSLRAEARLWTLFGGNSDDIRNFHESLSLEFDAEYLDYAAQLTESAELTVDAALSYMLSGRSAQAMERAREVMAGKLRWSDPATPARRGIVGAFGRIAYDAGDRTTAVRWLKAGTDEARKRRMVIWNDLHLLGDIYWEMYRFQGHAAYRDLAQDAWYEAKEIVAPPSQAGASPPEDAWKLWLNLAVLESSSGSSRKAEELLQEALVLFPERGEVKAAWARTNMDRHPAMARRLVAQNGNTDQAVLGITSLQIDPESITPRLYEARLWELFRFAVQESAGVNDSDSRIIVTFLLEYMVSRKNYSSMDVAVDRYLKTHPVDDWILSWRLAADASRWMGLINLVPRVPGEDSSYAAFRSLVRRNESWRGLHDSALFAFLAGGELIHLAQSIPESPISGVLDYRDAVIVSAVVEKGESFRLAGDPLGDRVEALERSRVDLEEMRKKLQAKGRSGHSARASAKAALIAEVDSLYSNALDDIRLARGGELEPKDKAALLYLEAEILRRIGPGNQAVSWSSEAIGADPSPARAQQRLNIGVLP